MAYFPALARVASLSEGLNLYSKVSTGLLALVIVSLIFEQYRQCGQALRCYDVMLISGSLVSFVGVISSFGMRTRFIELIRALVRSGSIRPQTGSEDFEAAIRKSVGWRCLAAMTIVTIAVFGGYKLAGHGREIEAFFAAWAASVVGERFGRLITYARSAGLISRSGGDFVINFWHPDNAGGFLPFSKFYLYSALLASIPAAWLSFWWASIPRLARAHLYDYSEWRSSLVLLWIVALGLFFFSFIRPLWAVHATMQRAKATFLLTFGWIPSALLELHKSLSEVSSPAAALEICARAEQLQKAYSSAQAVTTWPVDNAIVRRFGGLSLAHLSIPIFLKVLAGESIDYGKLIDAVFG